MVEHTVAGADNSGDSADVEKNVGLIPDRVAWDLPLSPLTNSEDGFQVFDPAGAEGGGRADALARTDDLGVYRTRFRAGGGENTLHSHPGDSVWLVLSGSVEFYGKQSKLIAALSASHGVMIPSGATYRFICTEDSVLLRYAATPPPATEPVPA